MVARRRDFLRVAAFFERAGMIDARDNADSLEDFVGMAFEAGPAAAAAFLSRRFDGPGDSWGRRAGFSSNSLDRSAGSLSFA